MTKKERIADLERRVAELEARPVYYQPTYYQPWWGINPPNYPYQLTVPWFTTTTVGTTSSSALDIVGVN